MTLKIAQIAPLYESVPPRLYGGTERVVSWLADALVEMGHEVTLFASADSRTRARLVPARDQAIRLDPATLKSDLAAHLALLHEIRAQADRFDVLHFHTDMLHFPFFEEHAARALTTVHGRLDMKDLDQAFSRWDRYGLVSISDAQRAPQPAANWVATVHHGLPEDLLRPVTRPARDYVAFLGRISPEKRPDRAVRIARCAGAPLRIAAKVDAADRRYYEECIRPMLEGDGVEYIGEIGDARKSDFLGNALALLFPIDWPEPFGLVMIEAMACGTPVIAWDHGSVREVVEDGVTGFIVRSEEEAVAAVEKAAALDRGRIRAVFERRFTARVMAENYLRLYAGLAGRRAERAADPRRHRAMAAHAHRRATAAVGLE